MKRRNSWSWPKWLWRWHHLASAFVLFVGVGMLIAALQFDTKTHYQARATSADYVRGWLWSDPTGWISLNDVDLSSVPGACPSGCGSYGVTVDTNTRELKGFGWSDKVGWVCFGATCQAHPDCSGVQPTGPATAYVNSGSGLIEVHGWSKVCNQGSKGWISLNCLDPGACVLFSYKVQYNTANKTFNGNPLGSHPVGNFSSLAWNGNSDGSGFGYIDFQYATLSTPNEPLIPPGPAEAECRDGLDNDLNGAADCADTQCKSNSVCQEVTGATDFWGVSLCRNGIDDDGDVNADCRDNGCSAAPECIENLTNTEFNGTALCANGFDDDWDGPKDCMDSGCAGYAGCPVAGEPATPPDVHTACSNGLDDDLSGLADCYDANCQIADPLCVPAWLQAKFGNVYAQQGIVGSASKVSQSTYCLTSKGSITGFSSGSGCTEAGAVSLTLPKGSTQYAGTLGSIDINGILAGRYGEVVTLTPGNITAALPATLAGKVYYVPGDATLGAKTFLNGTAATERGNGLLIVSGNLTISGAGTALDYTALSNVTSLRNLASFGIIVKKNAVGGGGNIYINSGATKVVGAYFAENAIYTGTTGGVDVPLKVFGLMAAYRINLERNYRSAAQAAEEVVFDGRAVANPPPGMGDVTKSLPASRDAF